MTLPGYKKYAHGGNHLAGFSYVEYLVTTIACTLVIFMPIPGVSDLSIFQMVITAIRQFGSNSDLLLSLP